MEKGSGVATGVPPEVRTLLGGMPPKLYGTCARSTVKGCVRAKVSFPPITEPCTTNSMRGESLRRHHVTVSAVVVDVVIYVPI